MKAFEKMEPPDTLKLAGACDRNGELRAADLYAGLGGPHTADAGRVYEAHAELEKAIEQYERGQHVAGGVALLHQYSPPKCQLQTPTLDPPPLGGSDC